MRIFPALLAAVPLLAIADPTTAPSPKPVSAAPPAGDGTSGAASGFVPAVTLGWYHNPEFDVEDGGTFDSTEYRFAAPLYGLELSDRLRVGFGLGYRFHQMQLGGPTGAEFGSAFDLHRLSLSATTIYTHPGGNWSFWGRFAPTLVSDGDATLSDAFTFTVIAGLGYAFSDDLSLVLGTYAGESFGEYSIYPALGVRWKINDQWRLNLVPPDITLTFEPSKSWRFHFSAFPGGGAWAVDPGQGSGLAELGYRDIRVGVGVDHEIRNRVWVSAWAGVNLFQQLEFRDAGESVLGKRDLDDSLFLHLGLRYEFW